MKTFVAETAKHQPIIHFSHLPHKYNPDFILGGTVPGLKKWLFLASLEATDGRGIRWISKNLKGALTQLEERTSCSSLFSPFFLVITLNSDVITGTSAAILYQKEI